LRISDCGMRIMKTHNLQPVTLNSIQYEVACWTQTNHCSITPLLHELLTSQSVKY